MKCPFCGKDKNKVIDSRISKDGYVIRRRRECLACERRFTTYERVEEMMPMLVKKDGRREAFDRQKILVGLQKACEKRPISTGTLEKIIDRIEQNLQAGGEKEVNSSRVGEEIMAELRRLDEVAYVRFASVYREFKDKNQFFEELKDLLQDDKI